MPFQTEATVSGQRSVFQVIAESRKKRLTGVLVYVYAGTAGLRCPACQASEMRFSARVRSLLEQDYVVGLNPCKECGFSVTVQRNPSGKNMPRNRRYEGTVRGGTVAQASDSAFSNNGAVNSNG